jgi:hypothetical protein
MPKEWSLDDREQLHKEANKLLDENLAPGEPVLVIIRGERNSAIIGTDRRVFVFKKGFMSGSAFARKLSTWDYRNITGVQVETGIMYGSAAIQAAGIQVGEISHDNAAKAPHAVPLMRDHFNQAKAGGAALRQHIAAHQSAPAAAPPAAPDAMDQLRKLSELRDAGILTDSEFEAKKAELLARM